MAPNSRVYVPTRSRRITARDFHGPTLSRTLLHPVWLTALVVLVLNDHLLKGSGLVPGWLTGKLSDVAGLFAAPLLLAVVLRVSSVRHWFLVHVAVGTVFSALQISPQAARAWAALMDMIGAPWTITSDLTDLFTLPALAGSFILVPRFAESRIRPRRWAEMAAASVGLFACVATSVEGSSFSAFETDTYLHNANEFDVVVRIRPLAEGTVIDCNLAEEDPALYLREPLFGDARSWTLAPDATTPVLATSQREQRACHAVWLDADNLAPSIVFWRERQFPVVFIEGSGITSDTRGWISLLFDDEGRGRVETEEDIVFPIAPLPTREPDMCTPSGAASRLAWGSPPQGRWMLDAVGIGPDGCARLDLTRNDETTTWDVCLPSGAFRFEAGDELRWDTFGTDAFVVSRLDPETGTPDLSMAAARGDGTTPLFGMQPIVDVAQGCNPIPEDTCGTVRQLAQLSVVGGGFERAQLTREPTRTTSGTESVDLYLVHASVRHIVNNECRGDVVGNDIEWVAVRQHRGT